MAERRIRAVAFDLEGTIVNLERFHFDGFINAAKEFSLEIDFQKICTIPNAIGGGDQPKGFRNSFYPFAGNRVVGFNDRKLRRVDMKIDRSIINILYFWDAGFD